MNVAEAARPEQGGPPREYGLLNRMGRLGEDGILDPAGRLGEGGRSQPPAAVERSLAREGATGEGLDAGQGCDVAA